MRSYRISKSTSTITATTPSVSVSGDSQPESSAGQRQQGSFVGIPQLPVRQNQRIHLQLSDIPS